MNKRRYILCALALALAVGVQAQDYLRMTERDLQGTARYVGMSGAMSAIGGDPSAVHANPAGLGLYQRVEVMLTMDEGIGKTYQLGTSGLRTNRFSVPQASVVWAFGTNNTDGVLFHNMMLSYQRLRTFDRSMYAEGKGGPSLGGVMGQTGVVLDIPYPNERTNSGSDLRIDEAGRVHAFGIHWAMNINHQWYMGLGMKILSYSLNSVGVYNERFAMVNADGLHEMIRNSTSLILSGAGVDFSAGLIYRPARWFRFGFAVETPSFGSLSTSTNGTISARTDTLRVSYSPYMPVGKARDFHMPVRTSLSTAFQIYDKAMIALQYDYAHQQDRYDTHSLRAGLEIVPVAGLYINAGYAFEFMRDRDRQSGATERAVKIDGAFNRQDAYFMYPQRSHYASAGIGYRGSHAMIQAAYQYRWQNTHLYAHENSIMNPYAMCGETHRIVLTIAWHSNWYW